MVKPASYYSRATSFAISVIALLALTAMLSALLYWLLNAAPNAEGEKQQYLLRFIFLVMGALFLTLIILLGVIARYVAHRLTSPEEKYQPLGHFDAWAEAGRRLRPEDAPPIEGFEDEGHPGRPDHEDPPPR